MEENKSIAVEQRESAPVDSQTASAKEVEGAAVPVFDPEKEKKLRRKIDRFIVPPVALLYLFCFVDRANIGNARLANLEADLGLKGQDFNTILSVFYVTYSLCEIPSILLCKYIGPGYFLPLATLGFGIVTIGTAFCENKAQMIACRILLGAFEAGMLPGVAYYLSRWYRHAELSFRLGMYMVMTPTSGAFGGLLASGILSLDRVGSWTQWRMIFGVEGIITAGIAVVLLFLLTDSPATARWLTAEEKELATSRVISERVGQSQVLDKMNLTKIKNGFLNPVALVTAFIFFCGNVVVLGISFFLPTIIRTIYPGRTTVEQQLLTVPPYVVGAFFLLFVSWLATRFNTRQVFIFFSAPTVMAGYAILLASTNANVRAIVACSTCRDRKTRCDGARPKCSACVEHGQNCVYSDWRPLNTATASREHIESLEVRLEATERRLEQLTGRFDRMESGSSYMESLPERPGAAAGRREPEVSINDAESEPINDSVDATDGVGSVMFTKEERVDAGFFGPSSNISFTRDIISATMSVLKRSGVESVPDLHAEGKVGGYIHSHVFLLSRPGSPVPSPEQRPGTIREPSLNLYELPPADQTLRLIHGYFDNTGLLFPYIHRERFIQEYRQLAHANLRNVRKSWLGVLNMILALSINVRYPSELSQQQRTAESKVFFLRAMALCEGQIRSTASLEIVQFLLLVSHYLQGTESSIQTWNFHGLAVKAAYRLGLHSKHALDQYGPLEREMRLRTWHTCVLLDRVLSMTLGRPLAIPDNHVRVEMPRPVPPVGSTNTGPSDVWLPDESLDFYNASLSLYMIMGRVLDTLYGSNLDSDPSQDVFNVASDVSRMDHQISEAKRDFPPTLQAVKLEDLTSEARPAFPTLRFRVILTLRYHNLRILAHRPLLQRYLAILRSQGEDGQQLSSLHQVGVNSLHICMESASAIIALLTHTTKSKGEDKGLLGAWWFSLYYIFNAALVIYSGLLIRAYADDNHWLFSLGTSEIRRDLLYRAVDSLTSLDNGNMRAEKCAQYILRLDRVLDSPYSSHRAENEVIPPTVDSFQHEGPRVGIGAMHPDLAHHEHAPFELDFSELMVPGDLDFLKYFEPSLNVS